MKRLAVLLVVVAAALGAAALWVPSDAATVNGTGISQATLNSDLTAIGKSPLYQCLLNAQVAVATNGQGAALTVFGVSASADDPHTFAMGFVDGWLQELVRNEVVAQVAASRGVPVTQADLASAHAELVASLNATLGEVNGSRFACDSTGPGVLTTLPTSFVNALTKTQATFDALYAHAAGFSLSPAGLRAYFDAHPRSFDTLCLRGLQASTQAQAQSYRDQLTFGTPFAQLATSAGQPTKATCIAPNSPSFAQARSLLGSAGVGGLSKVFGSAQTGYAVFELSARKPSTFAQAESAVRDAVLTAGSQKLAPTLNHLAESAHVSVNPRYGHWRPAPAFTIAPPPHPPASTLLAPLANAPRVQPAASAGPAQPAGAG